MTADEVWGVLAADRDYYAMSGGGVTLSGGEPLCQPEFALELLRRCRSAGIATAVETAGAVPFDVLNAVRPWVDLFLYDVKCMDDARHRRLTGVPNGQILANLRRLCALGSDVQIRMPVVPGCNDSEVGAVAAFAAGIRRPSAGTAGVSQPVPQQVRRRRPRVSVCRCFGAVGSRNAGSGSTVRLPLRMLTVRQHTRKSRTSRAVRCCSRKGRK